MKEELPGTVLFSSSSPCWGSVLDWGTSGGFPTCVSRMGEVSGVVIFPGVKHVGGGYEAGSY